METLEVWRRDAPGIRSAVARWADQEPTAYHRLFEFLRPESAVAHRRLPGWSPARLSR